MLSAQSPAWKAFRFSRFGFHAELAIFMPIFRERLIVTARFFLFFQISQRETPL